MKFDQMLSTVKQSKYLSKGDFPEPALVTIRKIGLEDVGKNQGGSQEQKWVLYFAEHQKGMVLNSTNLRRLNQATGGVDSEEWTGKKIVVYVDEDVEYAGEIVGGLRIRAARVKADPKPPPPDEDLDDGIPFK